MPGQQAQTLPVPGEPEIANLLSYLQSVSHGRLKIVVLDSIRTNPTS